MLWDGVRGYDDTVWLMRSEQSPTGTSTKPIKGANEASYLLLPFRLLFLRPKPWAQGMELWWPHGNSQMPVTSKDGKTETQEEPESPIALRDCHVTQGHLPPHFCSEKNGPFNLTKPLLPNTHSNFTQTQYLSNLLLGKPGEFLFSTVNDPKNFKVNGWFH